MTLPTSILVANRGEIACRVFRTAKRMGLRTIAVYSEADAKALHVRSADEAHLIGPAPARESYLDFARVLEAARISSAQSIHPGYGFLSENVAFAEAVIAAGLIWIGPPPAAIGAMAGKDSAKRLMAAAGVPVTPGNLGDDQSAERLAEEAAKIGYPVLIKAVSGGGGKGMRRVDSAERFADALAGAKREGASSFGDDRVLLETYVSRPRHIEVQVFGDSQGEVVHLFERDCSLQRRHQKVIEEAPAPGMDAATRYSLCAAAVRAAKAVNYVGAGTIEFIADASEGLRPDRIWFMEMNTRLQVEHPVTEAITGQDLVEWQIRVAAGERLPLRQDEIVMKGHAMEARLYAEDPAGGFLPSVGPLRHFKLPAAIRVDTGFAEGDEVTPFYDPMLAKLIAHGPDRESARASLAGTCASAEVWPVKCNAAFLARCLDHPVFVAGDVSTGFIEAEIDRLVAPAPPGADPGVVALLGWRRGRSPAEGPWNVVAGATGFRLNAPTVSTATVYVDGSRTDLPFDFEQVDSVLRDGDDLIIFESGAARRVSASSGRTAGKSAKSDGALRATMPGRVVAVVKTVGDAVKAGDAVVVLEAMKMEHALTAGLDGKVIEILVTVGAQVTEGAVLARVAADA